MSFTANPLPSLPQLTPAQAATPSGVSTWASQLISALQLWVGKENNAITSAVDSLNTEINSATGLIITNGTLDVSNGDTLTTAGLVLTGTGTAYTLTGLSNNMTGNPSVYQTSLIANPIASYSGVSWKYTTTYGDVTEIGLCIQTQSSTGLGSSVSNSGDKVGIYSAIQINAGGGNGWAINPLIYLASGANPYGGSQVCEFDFANYSGYSYGDSGVLSGGPICGGVQITGLGSGKVGYALGMFGNTPGTAPLWNVGLLTANNSIAQATIYDVCNANFGYQMFGTRQIGYDTTQATFGTGPIRIGNQQVIWSLNATGTGSVGMLQTGNNNYVIVGGVGAAAVACYGNFLPFTDNAYSFGTNTNRATAVWAVNGAIQTSDPALKTDIEEVEGAVALKILRAISPIRFRWRNGGYDMVDTEVEEEAHATESVTVKRVDYEVRDGKAVQVIREDVHENIVFDYVPAHHEDGSPVMDTFEEKKDKEGNVIIPKTTERHMHAHPRMVKRKVTKPIPVARPGRRTHWGWNAAQVKAAFDVIGLDFGGYVLAEDGTQHLRPDQLVPVLWRAVQELAAEVAALKAGAPQ